jgi:hypothetical protein
MSPTKKMVELRGGVVFESKWNLQLTAAVISDRLLAGTAFSHQIPGLREEVPAVKISNEIFGLTFVLYGDFEGEECCFTLEASPGAAQFHQLRSGDKTIDIGQWLAQLVSTVPEFHVLGFSPF